MAESSVDMTVWSAGRQPMEGPSGPGGPSGPSGWREAWSSALSGDWRCRAACRDGDPDRLFVRGAAQREAKMVCFGCPVRTECLAEALDHRIEFGVWGGMTERERRALLRQRPDVRSWYEVLQHADEGSERVS